MLRAINHVKQAAVRVDSKYLSEFQAKRQQQQKHAAETEDKIKTAIKQREHLLELEKLRVDVTEARTAKRDRLMRLVRRQTKILSENKRNEDEKESPTNILNSSHFDDVEPKRDCNGQREESDEDGKTSQPEDGEIVNSEMSTEELRLAAQAEAAEEIKMAKEVKRHLMAKFAEEQKEADAKIDDDKESEDASKDLLFGIEISRLCTLLNCTEEDLYESGVSGLMFDPVIEILENNEMDSDIILNTITGLVNDIVGYNARLLDIEVMQSIILAENAALKGQNEFKVGEDGLKLGDDSSFNPIPKKIETKQSQQQTFLNVCSDASKRAKERMNILYDRFERKIRTDDSDSQQSGIDSDSQRTETESADSKQRVVPACE